MNTIQLQPFHVIGITVRTSNVDGASGRDIPALWQKFISDHISDQIPNKLSSEVYSIYTKYEGDYLQPYTTLLGCPVAMLDHIPNGMEGMTFEGGVYEKFEAKGNLEEGVVYNAWLDIWQNCTNRAYTADFEIYGEKSMNPQDAVVDIFVSKLGDLVSN